jgi:predicted  nucleic acid-binding Zn-ribbon protein
MFNWFNRVVKDYDTEDVDIGILDRITNLELRVSELEKENINTTNCLYEIENRLQAEIDKIHPVVYNLNNNNWDQ